MFGFSGLVGSPLLRPLFERLGPDATPAQIEAALQAGIDGSGPITPDLIASDPAYFDDAYPTMAAAGITPHDFSTSGLYGMQPNTMEAFEASLAAAPPDLRDDIAITSGYRSPNYNRRINGATDSRHMYGDAIDINIVSLSPEERGFFSQALGTQGWGGVGGYSGRMGHVHIDQGPQRSWGQQHPGIDVSAIQGDGPSPQTLALGAPGAPSLEDAIMGFAPIDEVLTPGAGETVADLIPGMGGVPLEAGDDPNAFMSYLQWMGSAEGIAPNLALSIALLTGADPGAALGGYIEAAQGALGDQGGGADFEQMLASLTPNQQRAVQVLMQSGQREQAARLAAEFFAAGGAADPSGVDVDALLRSSRAQLPPEVVRYAQDLIDAGAQDQAVEFLLDARAQALSGGGAGIDYSDERSFRRDFESRASTFNDYVSAWTQLEGAIGVFAPEDLTGVDDVGAIFTFMRSLDPQSVVRDSETQMLQRTGTFPEWMVQALDQNFLTGAALGAPVRQRILEYVRRQYGPAAQLFEEELAYSQRLAEAYGFDPGRVAPDYRDRLPEELRRIVGGAAAPRAPSPAAPAPAAPAAPAPAAPAGAPAELDPGALGSQGSLAPGAPIPPNVEVGQIDVGSAEDIGFTAGPRLLARIAEIEIPTPFDNNGQRRIRLSNGRDQFTIVDQLNADGTVTRRFEP